MKEEGQEMKGLWQIAPRYKMKQLLNHFSLHSLYVLSQSQGLYSTLHSGEKERDEKLGVQQLLAVNLSFSCIPPSLCAECLYMSVYLNRVVCAYMFAFWKCVAMWPLSVFNKCACIRLSL